MNISKTEEFYYKKDENNKDILVDESGILQVMMEWEKPYMEAMIEKLNPFGDVLEIGFGMGYSANAIQKFDINSHTIIEADENVLKKLKEWAPLQKHKVNIIEGCWQACLPSMAQKFDIFFFDDYPHPEYPDPNNTRSLYFFHQIVQKNVKRGAKFTYFCTGFFTIFPCSVFMRWEMYEFVINEDIPESIVMDGYQNPEQILTRKKVYIPIITFNADSSEMDDYADRLAMG
jgi:predicted methyltransferase